jgi:hypothetical protein
MAARFEAPATPTIVMLCGLTLEPRSPLAYPLSFKQVAFLNNLKSRLYFPYIEGIPNVVCFTTRVPRMRVLV